MGIMGSCLVSVLGKNGMNFQRNFLLCGVMCLEPSTLTVLVMLHHFDDYSGVVPLARAVAQLVLKPNMVTDLEWWQVSGVLT
jgi:hypothetical protein